jgi:hypothetical protein
MWYMTIHVPFGSLSMIQAALDMIIRVDDAAEPLVRGFAGWAHRLYRTFGEMTMGGGVDA